VIRSVGITRLVAIGAATAVLWLSQAVAGEQTLPGATVESVVAIARRLNTTVAAASLDFDAAVHKIGTAGVLADPTLILEAWDVNRQGVGQRRIGFDQEVKLWANMASSAISRNRMPRPQNSRAARPLSILLLRVVAAHGEYNAAL